MKPPSCMPVSARRRERGRHSRVLTAQEGAALSADRWRPARLPELMRKAGSASALAPARPRRQHGTVPALVIEVLLLLRHATEDHRRLLVRRPREVRTVTRRLAHQE